MTVTWAVACRQKPASQPSPSWGKVFANPSLTVHQEQMQKWNRLKPKHYRYKLRYHCYCSYATFYNSPPQLDTKIPRWITLEVKDGKTISAYNLDGSANARYLEIVQYEGVEMMERGFRRMTGNIEEGFKANYAVYDERWGFPRYLANTGEENRMHVDYDFEIIEFENLSEADSSPH